MQLSLILWLIPLIAAVAVISVISIQNVEMKRQFAESSFDAIDLKLRKTLNDITQPVEQQLTIARNWGESGLLDMKDSLGLSLKLMPVIQNVDRALGVVFANDAGEQFSIFKDGSEWRSSCFIIAKGNLSRINEYNPTLRPWYIGGVAYGKKDVFWTYPYRFFGNNNIVITGSVSWMDSATAQNSVLGFDLLVDDILRELNDSTENGIHLSLIDNSGQILDLATLDNDVDTKDIGRSHLFVNRDSLDNSTLSTMMEHYWSQKTDKIPLTRFSSNGATYWLGISTLDMGPQKIDLAVFIPEIGFSKEITNNRFNLMGLALIITLLAVVLLFFIISFYLRSTRIVNTTAELNRLFSESGDVESFLHQTVIYIANIMRSPVCSIYFFNENKNHLVLKATYGLNSAMVDNVILTYGEGIVGQTLREMRSLCITFASKQSEYRLVEGLDDDLYDSFCTVPVLRGMHKVGVMLVQRESDRPYAHKEVRVLEKLALQLTSVLETAGTLIHLFENERTDRIVDDTLDWIKGLVGAPGYAMGSARVEYRSDTLSQMRNKTWNSGLTKEDFDRALLKTETELQLLQDSLEEKLADSAAMIFVAHIYMMNDQSFAGSIRQLIDNGISPPEAVLHVAEELSRIFALHETKIVREKSDDVKDLAVRILSHLVPEEAPSKNREGCIVVAKELFPSEILVLKCEKVAGIILESGGVTSHLAILCRSLQLPLLLTCDPRVFSIREDSRLFLNANHGIVYVNPSDDILQDYYQLIHSGERQHLIKVDQVKTTDGTLVTILANINLATDIKNYPVDAVGGIGLYRSEFPFMIRETFPSEMEQFKTYSTLVALVKGGEFTFRTLDIGGDKPLPYYDSPTEQNPFLGLRGIRFSLTESDVFKTQIRAILRAGNQSNLKIMFPMIQSPDELISAKLILGECIEDLKKAKIPHNSNPKIGMMVELPAAVSCIDIFAGMVDFVSIGTNDLIQYLLAVDRTNAAVAPLYQSFHPAVLKAIKQVADAANSAGIEVSLCGDMANNPKAIPFLMGVGITRLSVDPAFVYRVQQVVKKISMPKATAYANALLSAKSVEEALVVLGK